MSAATHLAPSNKDKLSTSKVADEMAVAALEAAKQDKAAKKKAEEPKKSKSNLELFKEELKRNQLEREERHKKRLEAANKPENPEGPDKSDAGVAKTGENSDLYLDVPSTHDGTGGERGGERGGGGLNASMNTSKYQQPVSDLDPNTTNIFISNLSPKVGNNYEFKLLFFVVV